MNAASRWQALRRTAPWLLLVALAIGWTAARLKPSDDISVLLPTGDAVVSDYYLVANAFRTLDSLYIDVSLQPGADADVDALFACADALHARLVDSGYFRRIQYRIDPQAFAALGAIISEGQPSLLSGDDWPEIDRRLDGDEIQSSLAEARRTLMRATGIFEQERLRGDPFNLADLAGAKFAGLGRRGQGVEIVDGAIVTQDGRHLLIFAIPAFPPSELDRSRELVSFLERTRDEIESVPGNTATIRFAGGHFAYVDNSEVIQRDIKRTTIAVAIGVGLLSLFAFRRPLAILYVLAPASFGLAAGTAVYTLFNPSIAHVVLGCASLLVGITVDYGIHVLYHEASDHAASTRRSLYLSMMAAAATTIGGFVSLLFSRVPGFQQMGSIGIVGILGSVLFATLVLPQWAARGPQQRPNLPVARWAAAVRDWVRSHAAIAVLVLACLAILAAFGASGVRFDGDLRRLSYLSPAHQRDDIELRAVWEPFVASSVVVIGATLDSALEHNDRLADTLNDLRANGVIDDYVSVAQILPSEATQRRRWAQWDSFWSDERTRQIDAETRAAATRLGFADGAFDSFFQRVHGEPRLLTLADYEQSGVADLVNARIADAGGETLLQSSFYTRDLESFHRASEEIRKRIPGAVVVNGQAFVEHAKTLIFDEMVWLAGWAVLLVGLCLFLAFGAIELVFAVLAPVVLSLLLTFGVLGWLDVPLNLISIVFVVFVVGAGDDYSIFLFGSALNAFRGLDVRQEDTGASVMLCAATTFLGFAALLLAEHPALHTIGVTASVGILACLVSCLVLSPILSTFLLPAGGRYGIVTWGGALRALWTITVLTVQTFVFVVLARTWYPLKGESDPASRGRRARAFIRWAFRTHLGGFVYGRNATHTRGDAESLRLRPAIVVANHQSLFDVVRLVSLPGDMVIVVKRWVIRTPLMGTLLRDAQYILAEPDDAAGTLEQCRRALDNGLSVLFFPEGTRSPDGRMRRFHLGAFELATRSGHDIVPMKLTNTRSCIRRSGFAIGQFSSVLHVLPRITRDTFDYASGARPLMRYVRSMMEATDAADWSLAQSDPRFYRRLLEPYRYLGLRSRVVTTWARWRDPLIAELDSLVPSTVRVLDLQCGLGLRSRLLAMKSRGRSVVGVDRDEMNLRIARAAARDDLNVSFRPLLIAEQTDGPFDTVLLVEGVAKLADNDLRKLLSAGAAALSEDGTIIVRAPWGARPRFEFANRSGRWYSRDLENYRGLIENAGLKIVSDRPDLARPREFVWILQRGAR